MAHRYWAWGVVWFVTLQFRALLLQLPTNCGWRTTAAMGPHTWLHSVQQAVVVPCHLQDPHPPLPETISPLLEDFLLKCFQKVCWDHWMARAGGTSCQTCSQAGLQRILHPVWIQDAAIHAIRKQPSQINTLEIASSDTPDTSLCVPVFVLTGPQRTPRCPGLAAA